MRFGPDPAGETVRAERIGVEVSLHGGGVDDAVVVVGGQRLAGRRVVEVGVRDVPLAVVVGVVAGGAEPVAEGGHLAAAQPAHPRIVEALADAVGLGDAVQVGVLAGEDRRAARHAGQRAGVVAAEADAVLVEPSRPVSVRCRARRAPPRTRTAGIARSSSVIRMTMSGRSGTSALQSVSEPGERRVDSRVISRHMTRSASCCIRRQPIPTCCQRHDRRIAARTQCPSVVDPRSLLGSPSTS